MKTSLALLALVLSGAASAAIERVPLKTGWKFVKADDPAIAVDHADYSNVIRRLSRILDAASRGDLSRAPATDWCAVGFDDSQWTDVRVPHDWGVMKSYDPDLPYGDGFLDVTGIGWYRRPLRVEGVGFVAATDNGFEGDMADFRLPKHKAFNGRVLGIVRVREGARGTLRVTVTAKGLSPASAQIGIK